MGVTGATQRHVRRLLPLITGPKAEANNGQGQAEQLTAIAKIKIGPRGAPLLDAEGQGFGPQSSSFKRNPARRSLCKHLSSPKKLAF
jgi:hypothetical protein